MHASASQSVFFSNIQVYLYCQDGCGTMNNDGRIKANIINHLFDQNMFNVQKKRQNIKKISTHIFGNHRISKSMSKQYFELLSLSPNNHQRVDLFIYKTTFVLSTIMV